jgi:hypothetical protein
MLFQSQQQFGRCGRLPHPLPLARNDIKLFMSLRAKRGVSPCACATAVREIATLATLARNDIKIFMSLRAERGVSPCACATAGREIATLAALARNDIKMFMSLRAQRGVCCITGDRRLPRSLPLARNDIKMFMSLRAQRGDCHARYARSKGQAMVAVTPSGARFSRVPRPENRSFYRAAGRGNAPPTGR